MGEAGLPSTSRSDEGATRPHGAQPRHGRRALSTAKSRRRRTSCEPRGPASAGAGGRRSPGSRPATIAAEVAGPRGGSPRSWPTPTASTRQWADRGTAASRTTGSGRSVEGWTVTDERPALAQPVLHPAVEGRRSHKAADKTYKRGQRRPVRSTRDVIDHGVPRAGALGIGAATDPAGVTAAAAGSGTRTSWGPRRPAGRRASTATNGAGVRRTAGWNGQPVGPPAAGHGATVAPPDPRNAGEYAVDDGTARQPLGPLDKMRRLRVRPSA